MRKRFSSRTNLLASYSYLSGLLKKYTVFMLWGILGVMLAIPVLADGVKWQEEITKRDGQTRVWKATEVKEIKDPFTGTFSQKTITHQYIEKGDGLNYNAGTKAKQKWLPSVETITPTDDAYFPYEAKQGPYKVRFGASINQITPIEYSIGNDTIRLGLKYLAFYDKANNTLKPLFTTLNHVNPTVESNKVTYKEVAPGIDVEYIYQKGVFKQNIKVKSKSDFGIPSSYGISTDNAYLVAVTELDTTDFSTDFMNTKGEKMVQGLLKGKGCDILFKKKGTILCTLAPSLAYADTEKYQKEINQYRHIYQDGNKQYLLEGISYQELQNIKAPLTLDYEIKTGGISSNETWKEGNTYYISGELTVNSGATLVIEPGTICKYSTTISLNAGAGGRIIAKGEKYNYILMTSWKDNTMGESVSSSAGDPTPSDYANAIRLSTGSSSGSIIEYCKIRYAVFGLYDYDTNLSHPIQNNIMRDMAGAIFLVGVSTCTVLNNLIDNCWYAGIFASSGSYLSNAILVARNNTINNCADNGVRIEYNRFEDFSNNLITSCGTAMRVINYTFGNHSYNSFYGNNVLYVGTSGGIDETTLPSTPYAISPNGSFYLDTAKTGCINAGSTTARALGLDGKVTQVPTTVSENISVDTSWDKIPRDTGLVDRGYHYDPVDVVVGSSTHPIIYVHNGYYGGSASLKIYPGVVVSYWRSLSQNTSQLRLRKGILVAHGHADDRIQFRNIFETGDMHTYSLGSGDSFGYYYGILFGSSFIPDSYAQFCEFYHAHSGIYIEGASSYPMYRRFSDNVFYGCQNGITAKDAYPRIENNLFISNSQSEKQIYLIDCYTAIIRNNTVIGNNAGEIGCYGIVSSLFNTTDIDISNNIFTGFNSTALKLDTYYYNGKISNNCYFNNAANNYSQRVSINNPIYESPRFAWNTASSCCQNGYFLAQTTGDASRTPLKGSYLDSSNGITVHLTSAPYYWSISAYANPESGGSYPLGCFIGPSGYSDSSWQWAEYVSDPTGYISISILNAASPWTINDGDYITLNFQNGSNLKVYLPAATFPECGDPWDDSNDYLNLWVAEDGSAYYSYSGHTVTSTGIIDQDASYAMNYDNNGLGKASFTSIGVSTCVNSGDTTVRAYGSTASSYSKDTGKVDIGYHAKNPGFIMVGENGRQFEYEDGTPFIASGGAVLWASLEYQDEVTRPVFDKYLKALKDKGVTALTMSFHQNRCMPWGYENNAQTAWAVSTAKGVFSNETAQWLDNYIDSLEKADLKLGLLVWQSAESYGTVSLVTGYSENTIITRSESDYSIKTTIELVPQYQRFPNPRDHYNPFWSGSTIFHGGAADSSLNVFEKAETIDYQTTTMKYYVDRWGDRESLIYWDPLLETDYYRLTPAQLMGWTAKVHKFIKDYELKKYGHRHLVTASAGRPWACYYRDGITIGGGNTNANVEKFSMPSMIHSFKGYSPTPEPIEAAEDDVTSFIIQTTYFNDPSLDFTCVHMGGDSTLSFPAIDSIDTGSLWYPALGEQWLRDSVGSVLASTTQFWLKNAFGITTARKRPYFLGLYYPPYFTPWVPNVEFFKDQLTTIRVENNSTTTTYTYLDVSTTLYAISTLLIDRHIAPEFHDMYNYYLNWALTAGGAAGPGFTGGEQVYNMFLPLTTMNGDPSSFYLNGRHTDYNLDTSYLNDTALFYLINQNGREYNTFTMQMLYDKLALYKVMTCVNWNSRTWDNLGGSNRINISGFTNVSPIYSGNSSNMIAYFCRDMRDTTVNYSTSTVTNMSVTFSGFPVYTPIRLTWFNPRTGDVISSNSFLTGSIQVTAPPFNRDIVAVLKPE